MTMLADNVLNTVRGPQGDPILIVFAGGGTGGHLYPALAVAEALRETIADVRFTFFGTGRTIDRHVLDAAGQELVTQEVKPLTSKPWRWPAFWTAWRRSMRRCQTFFRERPPAAVIGTGAFASAPAICQAVRMGVPTALLNPDMLPGRANRLLAARVSRVFVQWEESAAHFGSNVRVEASGCPVRADFLRPDGSAGYARFGLSPSRKTLLITGASLGARSINEAFVHLAPALGRLEGWQFLHLCGSDDFAFVRAAYRDARVPAACLAYTDEMPEAMAIADLIVGRAGASTLAEITAMGKPAILLPYPHHRDMHQLANAEALARRGAARIVNDRIDGARTAEELQGELLDLMSDEAVLAEMAKRAAAAGKPDAARRIAGVVKEWVMTSAGRRRGQ